MDVRISQGMPLSVCVRTDTGKVRSNNEDSWGSRWNDDGSLLVVVCDGMGGHEAGEVASRLAVDTILAEVTSSTAADPRHRIYNAFLRANEAIVAEGQRTGRRGMGTTGVLAHVRGRDVFVGLVGDSRLLHVRRGHLLWRTLDHTRVQSLVDRGVIKEEDARSHSDAGMLTRALGHTRMSNGEALEPEVLREPLQLLPGDALVMCSDGCHDLLEDWEIARAVGGATAAEASDLLVSMALDRGGHDNVTVAVVVAGERARQFDAKGPGAGEPDPEPPPEARPRSLLTGEPSLLAHPVRSAAPTIAPGAEPPRPATAASPHPPPEPPPQPAPDAPARAARPAKAAAKGAATPPVAVGVPVQEPPAWFWLAAVASLALLLLSLVMLAVAVWLAI